MKRLFIPLMVVVALSSCTTMKQVAQTTKPTFPTFDTEGHRGARGLMPENSIPAMIKAIDLGVSTIELDCQFSKDHKVIVSHDNSLNPAHTLREDGSPLEERATKRYTLYAMDYDEIRKYDIGTKYYDAFPKQQKLKTYIPLLSELIDSVQAHIEKTGKPQVFYNIETKSSANGDFKNHPEPETFVKLLVDVLEEKKITPWVIIQSFDIRTLQVLHEKYPHIKTSYLISKGDLESNLTTLGFTPDIYSPNYKLVNAELVNEVHNKNIKIIPWTVNTKEEIKELKDMGVDGIISDYPNLFFE